MAGRPGSDEPVMKLRRVFSPADKPGRRRPHWHFTCVFPGARRTRSISADLRGEQLQLSSLPRAWQIATALILRPPAVGVRSPLAKGHGC